MFDCWQTRKTKLTLKSNTAGCKSPLWRIGYPNRNYARGLIYINRTTGNVKRVMICHDNYQCISVIRSIPEYGTVEERMLSFLPLNHIAGIVLDSLLPIVTTAERPQKLFRRLNARLQTPFIVVERYVRLLILDRKSGARPPVHNFNFST